MNMLMIQQVWVEVAWRINNFRLSVPPKFRRDLNWSNNVEVELVQLLNRNEVRLLQRRVYALQFEVFRPRAFLR